ncbi:MAG TPA: Smr/MutS family protein, partial [Thermodesulfovibrionia bacterium]|nr:Smr/MutS family protein [Thermodesulfovibrionia bacterium]
GHCVISHCNRQIKCQNILPQDPEYEAKAELKALVQGKGDFRIADTSEYMEGLAPGVPRWVAEKLHKRFFSYQDYIDLHGLCVEAAYDAFKEFMKASVEKGLNCVLIVHGRGMSSPETPKIKQAVRLWLTRGIWRKWVLAFTSAQIYDGGAGATYVLLSRRQLKGAGKKRRKCSGTK